jgi:hypothetical protein
MPFGRYKNLPLSDLPFEYQTWLSQLDDLREPWRRAVFAEIENRENNQGLSREGGLSLWVDEDDIPIAKEIVDAGYRSVARKLHPDSGGSHQSMLKLNAVAGSLRKQLSLFEVTQ